MNATNSYCKALGIEIPRLEIAKASGEANYYSLLIVALLERGRPITLEEAAKRFEAAGIAPASQALASLKRCRPARPPIYRDGNRYALDPHDDEVDLWAFRLGLLPPKVAGLEAERDANAERLARMRRVVIHVLPAHAPVAVVLADVERREVVTFLDEEIITVPSRLADYDVIAAMDVRTLLRALAFDPGERRLAELGPPQKTVQLNKRGRTLRITTELLILGSCRISRPLSDDMVLWRYRHRHEQSKLRRRLEADGKSLVALYQYGRLHGTVRLRWGFLDERIPTPWVHRDECTIYDLMTRAQELGVPLEVVVGSAPGWVDPWRRAECAYVRMEARWELSLVDAQGRPMDLADVQLARLIGTDDDGTGGRRRAVSESSLDQHGLPQDLSPDTRCHTSRGLPSGGGSAAGPS